VSAIAPVDHDVRERLARLDSCALSDALDRLGQVGVLDGITACSGHGRVFGRVITVLLGPPSSGSPAPRHLCTAAVEAGGAGDVIVVAHQGRRDCAGWGGNLSRAARRRGIEATIVDGAVRDVDEADEIGYPVFATSATPRTARGRAVEHAWGEPVEVAGVSVATGDWIVADRTGVVVVAVDRVSEVLDAAEAIVATEAAMAQAIDAGAPVSSVMGASYERLLHGDGS
jgi:4-hydroxy-4-methyl-2-oxoglutarate aldolase